MKSWKSGLYRVGGWGSGGSSAFLLVIQGGERDLRRIEKLVGPLLWNRVDEYALGYAGDEVADAALADKRG